MRTIRNSQDRVYQGHLIPGEAALYDPVSDVFEMWNEKVDLFSTEIQFVLDT